jgi:hypothetical protein
MAAILHHRFTDNVVRLDNFTLGRAPSGGGLMRVWCVGPDGVLACRWTPAPRVRGKPARGPVA